MNGLPKNYDSLNRAAGCTSSEEALRETDSPGVFSGNKVLLINADAVKAFLDFKKNENNIYTQTVKAVYKSLSWRQIEALENIANVYSDFCHRAGRENSGIKNMELFVNIADYEQLLIFENMLNT